ncbi:tRNA (guanosine(18)-2'-O)-methyltransferase [Rubripirellula obstinata]|uniref:tRNA (Guanosine(18)-2'-O)-methyltransferase n=2 Tax=Rubripirellula obstinata TaxID=406547 RepID=A0A5B1CL59_9BACT|nr:RNA methyltransferase [Rubripirellula obstinata]KAA1261266.1 tRNA (guanosine(18)-2'-O)-methyltransferase [Rubripirellula obstinata]
MAIEFTEACDIRLDPYRDVKEKSISPESQRQFIVEGKYCVDRLAKSGISVHSVVVREGLQDEVADWFSQSPLNTEIDIYVLSTAEIRKLVGFDFHRGVIACGIGQTENTTDELLTLPTKPKIVLAALGIGDRDNLGSIIRTATAMGVHHLIRDRACVDPLARRVIRTSMATVFSQTIYLADDANRDLKTLVDQGGFRTIATTLSNEATPIDQLRPDHRPIILMMGNESTGLSKELQETASDRVTIPMNVAADSLNVSVATAIFLYELTRVRS